MTIRKTIVRKNNSRKKLFLISAAVAAVLIGTLAVLELTNTTHLLHRQQPPMHITASQNTKGEVEDTGTQATPNNTTPSATTPDSTAEHSDNKDTGTGGSTATLTAPSGNFVSAHKVPRSAPIASVCNTTAGATCKITFTLNGTTKTLAAQTTDKGGSTYWNNWTPASLGLGVGTWKIQATATLGSQTQSVDDALNLEVTE